MEMQNLKHLLTEIRTTPKEKNLTNREQMQFDAFLEVFNAMIKGLMFLISITIN